MRLTDEAIEEFKEIYLKDYGIVLGNDEAKDKAIKLFKMINVLFKKIKK